MRRSALFQGFFIAYEGIPAFIVTLAGLSVIRGIALLITGGYSIPVDPASLSATSAAAWLLGVPVPALIAVVVLVVGYRVSTRRRFGRYVTGIGANAEAVRRAGVDIRRTTLLVYVLSSTAAALAGIILAARLGSGSSNAGHGFELDVIAAVVLGGTSLFGGRGTMVGTMLGALTVAVIANGLILAHMSPFLSPDRHRDDHPDRHLAELPPVPATAVAEPINEPSKPADRRALGHGDDRARPDARRRNGRDADARAHPARCLRLVEAALLRLRYRASPSSRSQSRSSASCG